MSSLDRGPLMLGDQIVGNSRSNVAKQWDRLYDKAAEILANVGVELAKRPDRSIESTVSGERPLGRTRTGFLSVLRRIFGNG